MKAEQKTVDVEQCQQNGKLCVVVWSAYQLWGFSPQKEEQTIISQWFTKVYILLVVMV